MDQNYFSHERPEMLPLVPARRARVLEVGCGEGRFIGALPGVEERWGIEPSAAAETARPRLDHVFHSTFEAAAPELPKRYFDLVICNDVIEHMPDHAWFLAHVADHIADGGMLIGSIPNVRYFRNMFEFLLEKDWYYRDAGILDRTHLAFFTERSLRRSLEQAGYAVLTLRGINRLQLRATSGREKLYGLAAHALSAASLGYFADTLNLQFGFQARPIRDAA